MKTISVEELISGSGKLGGTSKWLEVTQERIDRFADATGDHQFIHIDDARAKAETPFGGTIAHGFLTLSLLSSFVVEAVPRVKGAAMGINYGFEKVRFLNPVPSGAKIRAHFRLKNVTERKPGELLSRHDVTVEIEGVEKPALVAEWLGLSVMPT